MAYNSFVDLYPDTAIRKRTCSNCRKAIPKNTKHSVWTFENKGWPARRNFCKKCSMEVIQDNIKFSWKHAQFIKDWLTEVPK